MKSCTESPAYSSLRSDVAKQRLEYLFGIAQRFYPEQVEDIFVSEVIDQEGKPKYESVWMFSASYMFEFKEPMTEEKFDLAGLRDRIDYLQLTKKDFDFDSASESSRLTVQFATIDRVSGEIKAHGENCVELLRIIKERLLPNLAVKPGAEAEYLAGEVS